MKKIFALFCMSCLMCSALFSQTSEHQILVVPRAELNPYIDGNQSFDLGNSSLYTLFEGDMNEHLSYSVMGHWLSDDPSSLYINTMRSDDANWLDWANVTATFGDFDITLGKQGIMVGSIEQDAYDYDVCINLSSTVWNNLYTYNWGLALGYSFDDTYLAAQVTTSPFAEYHYSGRFAYTLSWMGEYEFYEPIWSFNIFECEDKEIYLLAIGNRFDFDEVEVAVELIARSYDASRIFEDEISLIGAINYELNDAFDLSLKGGWERNRSGIPVFGYDDEPGFLPTNLAALDKAYYFGGMLLNYYPLRANGKLRLHSAVAANNYAKGLSVSLGATYYLAWAL